MTHSQAAPGQTGKPRVISASRRTDLARCFPEVLAGWLNQGQVLVRNPYNGQARQVDLRPAAVQTLVLWSKDFSPLLANVGGLRRALERLDQVFLHLTVTGLGGTAWEPDIQPWVNVVKQFAPLVRWTGSPERVNWRFDPVVVWREGQKARSNLNCFLPMGRHVRAAGIGRVTVSLCQWYATARNRCQRRGLAGIEPKPASTRRIARWLQHAADQSGLGLSACGHPGLLAAGLIQARCIDGLSLTRMHPRGRVASIRKDAGQRPACGCTEATDIGSYDLACPNGCAYCYARPAERLTKERP